MTSTSSEESERENNLKSEQTLLAHWTDWKPNNRAEQVLLSGLLQRTGLDENADRPKTDTVVRLGEALGK
jgi:hypothetical protein